MVLSLSSLNFSNWHLALDREAIVVTEPTDENSGWNLLGKFSIALVSALNLLWLTVGGYYAIFITLAMQSPGIFSVQRVPIVEQIFLHFTVLLVPLLPLLGLTFAYIFFRQKKYGSSFVASCAPFMAAQMIFLLIQAKTFSWIGPNIGESRSKIEFPPAEVNKNARN